MLRTIAMTVAVAAVSLSALPVTVATADPMMRASMHDHMMMRDHMMMKRHMMERRHMMMRRHMMHRDM